MSPLKLFKLWSIAMRREGLSPVRHALPLAVHALRSLPFVTPERWRRRMRACSRCPIYNRETKQCRSDVPVRLGCGCSCPVKFLFAGETCWAREQGIYGLGWPEDVT
jgi:hypothetical protein